MTSTKTLLLMTMLTLLHLTDVLLAAHIKPPTVESQSSKLNITDERSFDDEEEDNVPATDATEEDNDNDEEEVEEEEEEEHEAEEEDSEGPHKQHHEDHDDAGSDLHEEDHSHHWNYHEDNGPKSWSASHKECGGEHQSPIDIQMHSTKLNELLTEISLLVHNVSGDTVSLQNNGHSVNLAYGQTTMRLEGGAYDHTYRVAGVHFHWGGNDREGSEHMIQGRHFPLEMHVVCYDEDDYDGVGEALSSSDGLAVLGVLFTVSMEDNLHLSPVISHLQDVSDPDESVSLEYFDLEKLLPSNRKNYFRYRGSLTTPPCSESVVWTVFEATQTISSTQLAEFRKLYEKVRTNGTGDRMLYNYRPVQQISKRIVYRSFPAAIAVSHLSPDDDDDSSDHRHMQSDDDLQSAYSAATSLVMLNKLWLRRNILIGGLAVYVIAIML